MWCSPRLESAGGAAELPNHGGVDVKLRRRRRPRSGQWHKGSVGAGVRRRLRVGARDGCG
jgi:hypothetical protein